MFWLESAHLQLNGHETAQPPVKEQEINGKILAPHLHGIFRPDITKVSPKFCKKMNIYIKYGLLEEGFGVSGNWVVSCRMSELTWLWIFPDLFILPWPCCLVWRGFPTESAIQIKKPPF